MNINPFDLLKNAQKIQEEMGSFQERLAAISVTGSAGGGMVELDITGRMELLAVRIAPEALAPPDREMLEDLVAAAFTSALAKLKEAINKEMGALAGLAGLGGMVPPFPGFGAP